MKNRNKGWSDKSKDLASALHKELQLTHSNWHLLRSNSKRRAAEQLSAALCQLLQDGEISEIEELLIQSSRWLRGEIKDPGCSNH